jgi:hypothetical protein
MAPSSDATYTEHLGRCLSHSTCSPIFPFYSFAYEIFVSACALSSLFRLIVLLGDNAIQRTGGPRIAIGSVYPYRAAANDVDADAMKSQRGRYQFQLSLA